METTDFPDFEVISYICFSCEKMIVHEFQKPTCPKTSTLRFRHNYPWMTLENNECAEYSKKVKTSNEAKNE